MPHIAETTRGASNAQLAELYRAHAPMVRRALRQLGVGEAQLDDAAQDVFVVLVRRIEDFDRDRSLTNWLWGIAKGVASGYRRSGRRRGRLHGALAQTVASAGALTRPGEVEARCGGSGRPTWAVPMPRDARSLEREVAGRQAANILRDFLGSLDAGKCAVFVLSDLEGCTGPEIAERLAVNVNTVYARLRAARRSFRDALAGHQTPDARPLFAGLLPSLGKPSSWMAVTAVATAVALPLPREEALDSPSSRIAGYLAIPNAPAVEPATEPAESPVATSAPLRERAPTDRAASAGDSAFASALDYPFDNGGERATESPLAGQGLGTGGERPLPQGHPMLTTLALTAALAGPTPTIENDADADEAARVGTIGQTSVLIFEEDELTGDVLRDDGSVILHRPRIQYSSLISIRGHFVPELIQMATDV